MIRLLSLLLLVLLLCAIYFLTLHCYRWFLAFIRARRSPSELEHALGTAPLHLRCRLMIWFLPASFAGMLVDEAGWRILLGLTELNAGSVLAWAVHVVFVGFPVFGHFCARRHGTWMEWDQWMWLVGPALAYVGGFVLGFLV